MVSFCFPYDIVASWLFSNNLDANFEKSPLQGCKVCNIKSIMYCSLCMLHSVYLDPFLVDFTGMGPLTGENVLGPSAVASLYFQFAR